MVKKLEIRWKLDHFLSRIGGLNPGLPAIARPHGGSLVLTDFQWHSSRIWQGGAGFQDRIPSHKLQMSVYPSSLPRDMSTRNCIDRTRALKATDIH